MALKKHLFWYSISSIFSFCIGFIKLPLYTTHFSPQNFGYYSLVSIGYSFISIAFLNWAGLSLWRFYIIRKEEGRLRELYSTIFKLFLILATSLFLASLIVSFLLTDPLLKKLIFFGGISFISTELANIALSHLKINQRSKLYTIITCFQVLLAFAILLLLTFIFNFGIEAFLLA
ncbi:oligosaccharide flippase family protein [Niabella ginsengisoli]|uniref:oligosaccharide flippase family protein n=1 Tax=Niabella ginsengisoli TaxID=522298 RepID=UPI00374DCA94